MIRLLFFASLRDRLGVGDEQIELPHDVTDVSGLTGWLQTRGGNWSDALADRRLRVAVNQVIGQAGTPVRDGDEVAWFPPVTGG